MFISNIKIHEPTDLFHSFLKLMILIQFGRLNCHLCDDFLDGCVFTNYLQFLNCWNFKRSWQSAYHVSKEDKDASVLLRGRRVRCHRVEWPLGNSGTSPNLGWFAPHLNIGGHLLSPLILWSRERSSLLRHSPKHLSPQSDNWCHSTLYHSIAFSLNWS